MSAFAAFWTRENAFSLVTHATFDTIGAIERIRSIPSASIRYDAKCMDGLSAIRTENKRTVLIGARTNHTEIQPRIRVCKRSRPSHDNEILFRFPQRNTHRS